MIENDCQLEVVRGQLATAESALDDLRREVKPQNEQMYRLMAESYVEMILSLRAEIDAYLGIATTSESVKPIGPQQSGRGGHGLSSAERNAELEGVIRSVDLDAQTFVLRERPDAQNDLPCEYGPELEEVVKESLDCRVIVSGVLQTSPKTNKSKLAADTIELHLTHEESEA